MRICVLRKPALASKMWEVYYTAMEPVKAPNLSLLTKAHENKWVAFSPDYQKLLAVASSLIDLTKKLGRSKGIVMRVLPPDVGYAPSLFS